jgi:uncharacterized membrane protein YgcG
MPEQNPESKPSEKPSEAQGTPPEGTQPQQGRGRYIDYNALPPGEAAIMLKRIRARMKRIMRDIDIIMNILKYGANAGQGQGQQAQQGQYGKGYSGRGGYSGRNYGGRSYGGGYSRYSGRRGRRTSSGEEEEDVNY